MQNIWNVGINSWIIQDGNYSDFTVNEHREFAIEFRPLNLSTSKEKTIYAKHINDSTYDICGKVLYQEKGFLVIDIGIKVFWETDSKFKTKDFVKGQIFLGIDPFFYFEYGNKNAGIPELIYQWEIIGIKIETSPWIEKIDENGTKFKERDEFKMQKRPIYKTDAWKDDDGSADYILECLLMENNPKRKLTTAST